MNTAEELAQFCKDNGTGSGMTKKWTLKHFTTVVNLLQEDEVVLFAFVGIYNYISTTQHDGNYAIAITNDRIVLGQKKMFGENVNSILRKNLNDVSKSTGMVWGVLTIDTYKEKFNIVTNKDEINRIYEGVNQVLYENTTTVDNGRSNTSNPVKSYVEVLKEYKDLLDSGVITLEEFNKKKEEILK